MDKPKLERIGVGAVTFLSWTLAAASLVGWWLHTAPSRPGSALGGGNVQEVSVDAAAVARFLGQPEAAAAVSQVVAGPAARMSLHGVVAASSHAGVALISVDGKPVRSYRVGSKVDEGWYVVGVERRRALLGDTPGGPSSVSLDMADKAAGR